MKVTGNLELPNLQLHVTAELVSLSKHVPSISAITGPRTLAYFFSFYCSYQ